MTTYAEAALSSSLRYLADSQAAISNNIANATTSAYKRRTPIAHTGTQGFHSLLDQTLPAVRYGESTDFTLGGQRATNDMNLALGEDQFFRVEDNHGAFYTRRGELIINAEGYLVTPNGERYLDIAEQPIQIGQATELRVASDGTINARVANEDRVIAQLGVFRVDDAEHRLTSVGRSLFVDRQQTDANRHRTPSVRQGYAEDSNVDVLRELIQMINVQRSFDATTRAMQTIDRIQSSFAQAMQR